MHLSSVVFPAPLLPRTAAHWPSSMAKLTSRRISGPEGLYLKDRPFTSTIAAAPFQQQIEENRRAEEGGHSAHGQLHGSK